MQTQNNTIRLERDTSYPSINGTVKSEIGKIGSVAEITIGSEKFVVNIDPLTGQFSWTATTPLADGDYNVSIRFIDAAQNAGAPMLITMIVDTTPPEAPLLMKLEDDVGGKTGDFAAGDTTDDKRPTLSGSAQKGATVYLRDADGNNIGSAVADKDTGIWTMEPSQDLKDGSNSLTLVAEETFAGKVREGAPSAAFTIVIGADVIPDEDAKIGYVFDNAGSVTGNISSGGATDDQTPTLHGIGAKNGTINLRYGVSGGTLTTIAVIADADGKWEWTPPSNLNAGDWTFEVQNASGQSNWESFSLKIDPTLDRDATISTVFDDVGTTGNVANGGTTDDNKPTLSGTAKANTLINIYDDTTLIGSVMSNASGAWGWTAGSALQLKTYHFNVADEVGGVVGKKSANWDVTITQASSNGFDSFIYGAYKFASRGTEILPSSGLKVTSGVNPAWIDTHNRLLFDSGTNKIEFPAPTDYVQFWHNNRTTAVYFRAFNANGMEIGDIEIPISPIPGNGFTQFASRGGELISYITFSPLSSKFEMIGLFSIAWGDGVLPGPVDDGYGRFSTNETDDALSQGDVLKEFSDDEKQDLFISGSENKIDAEIIFSDVAQHKIIDLTGTGGNTLKLDLATLIAHGEKDLFIEDGKSQLVIKGNQGDVLQLSDILPEGSDISEWKHQEGTVTVAGVEYQVYSHGDDAELLVQQGVKTELV